MKMDLVSLSILIGLQKLLRSNQVSIKIQGTVILSHEPSIVLTINESKD